MTTTYDPEGNSMLREELKYVKLIGDIISIVAIIYSLVSLRSEKTTFTNRLVRNLLLCSLIRSAFDIVAGILFDGKESPECTFFAATRMFWNLHIFLRTSCISIMLHISVIQPSM